MSAESTSGSTVSVLDQVLADLAAESAVLEAMVAGLDDSGWRTPTPAAGWDVATQVAHVAWTDEVATAAATDKEAWDAFVLAAIADPTGYIDAQALAAGAVEPAALLERWQQARAALEQALRGYPAGQKMPWFGPPMSPTSMATARFMETWAHGLDVADALGIEPERTDRVRHVAHLGVRTRDFAFATHGLEPPGEEFRIELVAPVGRALGLGAGRRHPAGDRLGPRLLSPRHPAPPPRGPRPGGDRPRRRPLARPGPGLRRPSR